MGTSRVLSAGEILLADTPTLRQRIDVIWSKWKDSYVVVSLSEVIEIEHKLTLRGMEGL